MKICKKCNIHQHISCFSKAIGTKDGRRNECKSCTKLYKQNLKNINLKNREMYIINNPIKKCNKCVKTKELEHFVKDCNSKDGRHSICIKCKTEYDINYRKCNPKKVKEKRDRYFKKYPEVVRAKDAKRRASKKHATPKWVCKLQKEEIKNLYKKAILLEKESGIKYHIDHIIPLSGKDVCGLHVPWNLTILEDSENILKSNRFDGTYENISWKEDSNEKN